MLDEKAIKITNAFTKYVETGDKTMIGGFNRQEIEFTVGQYHSDKGWSHYEAMGKRIQELKEEELYKTFRKDKWKDRIVGFILGIVATIITTIGKAYFMLSLIHI